MTREEAIDYLTILGGIEGITANEAMALEIAIEALEQEPILDKIRAEIENHCGLAKENHCRYCSRCFNLMGVREILEIIDKYKAEIEPQESEG